MSNNTNEENNNSNSGSSSTRGALNYQSNNVERSLRSKGGLYLERLSSGGDNPPVGLETIPVLQTIHNGRLLEQEMTLDNNGFALVSSVPPAGIDFLNEDQLLNAYYEHCRNLVKEQTGARKVYAFDHNVRMASKRTWLNPTGKDEKERQITGGNEIQAPALIVHNDFSLTSAPLRLKQLSRAPLINDVLRKVLPEGESLIPASDLEEIEAGRYVFINVWRNISDIPVHDTPLAMCDYRSLSIDDLITFEIRYADRIGENYLARHTPNHKWYYYPRITKNEAILLKVWDSTGDIIAKEKALLEGLEPGKEGGVASFSCHSAFKDENEPAGSPGRESIEVRLLAIF